VVLDNTRFRRLAMELRVRRLKEEPITFSFGLNECRALARLSVDGKDLLEHARKAAWRG
jgi:hypothetical protein